MSGHHRFNAHDDRETYSGCLVALRPAFDPFAWPSRLFKSCSSAIHIANLQTPPLRSHMPLVISEALLPFPSRCPSRGSPCWQEAAAAAQDLPPDLGVVALWGPRAPWPPVPPTRRALSPPVTSSTTRRTKHRAAAAPSLRRRGHCHGRGVLAANRAIDGAVALETWCGASLIAASTHEGRLALAFVLPREATTSVTASSPL